jgi:predicted AlkP superfamily pyrophosphatase or phosphodiesterase
MKEFIFGILWLATLLTTFAETAAPAARPQRPLPAVEHVVIIIVDGLRPDRALLADAPAIRSMVTGGAYTFWARTTDVAVTLPSCTSMLTGVKPGKHGVNWNKDQPADQQGYPSVPTVLEMASGAGYTTALVAGKSKFVALDRLGTITTATILAGPQSGDANVAAEAVRTIEAYKPELMCFHFPDVDAAGHKHGWGSREQLAQIEKTDAQIATVLAALDRAGLRESTVVLLTADHGGAGLSHGGEDARSKHIPWVVSGADVKRFYDLTQNAGLQVNTEDTCATVCWLLGLPQQPYFDGKPIGEAFDAVK